MRVILLEDIKGVGKKFNVKNVNDGYARNFLLPRKLAKVAGETDVKNLETQKETARKKEEENKKELEALAKNLENKVFEFKVKAGEKGEVFGSVAKHDIEKAISASGNIEALLGKPIKKLGEHRVDINLGKGIKTSVKINVISL